MEVYEEGEVGVGGAGHCLGWVGEWVGVRLFGWIGWLDWLVWIGWLDWLVGLVGWIGCIWFED